MNNKQQFVVLVRRPVWAFLILWAGLTAWGWAFVPFIEELDPLEAMPSLAIYSWALSGMTIGIVLQAGSRLYWVWLLSLAALILTLLGVTIVYGSSLELFPSSATRWARNGIFSWLAFTVLFAAKGWLPVVTRKTLRSEN